ncbi:MAG: hypothetical protein GY866_25540, partial [Proteobacteria bacterium]|nr:hypothetical protein [Pseudomonadota bacterium]
MDNLTLEEQRIVGEEESNLLKLYVYSPSKTTSENRDAILQQITELNEAIPEANSDDLPQITEQLTRLDSLMNQSDLVLEEDVVLDNPYFAHIRLREESRARDLYIGTKVYRSPDGSIQIIDWKTSPIALIYFLYDEGDEYDEEIDGRWFEGKIEIKRIVKIEDGEIVRIQQGDILLVKNRRSGWYRTEGGLHLLKGGAGTAARPENTSTVDPKLGMDRSGEIRRDKLLPEITALIDSEQFNLITQPESGIVAIQGTAGSGKTTVALHRVAWLHFRDQQRFAPNRMIVMVFNKALANYISKVLPSLGVDGVETDYFENWASDLRIRLFGGRLPKTYSEQTPVVVIRFKKHPVLLRIIDEFLRNKETTFTEKLDEIIRSRDIRDFPLQALKALPLVTRQFTLHEWIEGKSRFQDGEFPYGAETTSLLQRLIGEYIDPERSRIDMVIHYWEELFTNFEFLKERFLDLAGN